MTSQPPKSLSEYQRLPQPSTNSQYYKHFLEAVCNNATLALFVMDESQQCVYMNPAAEQLTGYTLAEVQGRALHNVIHHTRPDGRPYPLCECPIDQVFPQNNQEQGEEVFVHRDGHFYPVAYTASPIREGNQTIGTVIEVRDITQEQLTEKAQQAANDRERALRQEAEAAKSRAETVLQSITDAFVVFDRDWRYLYVNQSATQLLMKTEAELIGRRVWDVFPDLINTSVYEAYHRSLADQVSLDFEFLYPVWNRWFVNRVYPSGSGISVFVSDITDRKQREAERQEMLDREKFLREQAEQANRIKDEFLAVLSHELRTPLNPILGWVKMLKSGKCPPAKTPHALETIERNALLQTQLIEDLLDVSRILQGKVSLNVDSVDLVEATEAALETVQLAAESKSIKIRLNLDSTVGAVRGDANRIQQVIWNLLSNAVKFTPSAGRVEVSLSQVGTDAQLQIRDTGKGIRADVLPYVFDRFRQADSSTTRQFGGLGLGLAIARHIVELHGGSITAESLGENRGATFTVRLPIARFEKQANSGTDFPRSQHNLSGIKVLTVDDEPDNLDFLTFLLEAVGAIVESASSARLALTKLAEFSPDLVISDIAMPNFDGYELIRQIREQDTVPAIALTAFAGEINRQKILAAGFQGYLAKPVDPDELVEVIGVLLKR